MRTNKKKRATHMVITAYVFSIVAIVLGISGSVTAMSGGVLGIFLIWSANALGMLSGVLLMIGAVRGRHRRKLSITVGIISLIVLGFSLFIGFTFLHHQIRNPLQRLANNSSSQHFTATRIECQFGEVRYTIHDPHNQIGFRYGGPPASVNMIDELRVVQFVDTDVSLHCMRNTISLDSNGGKIGAWMGAYFAFESMAFTVDRNGDIQPTDSFAP